MCVSLKDVHRDALCNFMTETCLIYVIIIRLVMVTVLASTLVLTCTVEEIVAAIVFGGCACVKGVGVVSTFDGDVISDQCR